MFIGREAPEGLKASGVVIGLQKELEVRPELVVAVVMVAPDSRVLEGAVHPLDLTIGPGVIGLGEPVLDVVLRAGVLEGMSPDRLENYSGAPADTVISAILGVWSRDVV